jgi:RNA polymerase sigma-70 factor, ECF subfamily
MESDEAVYERMCGGDMRAFDALYERYERPLFGFVFQQLRDQAEAEDVFHETFMAVLRQRGSPGAPRSFRAWVFQVARNNCLNRARSRKRGARALDVEGRSEAPPASSPESLAERRQLAAALEAAVKRLPPALSELYALRAAGLSYEEIADVLGVPLGTVKSRLHDMVARLREEMIAWTAG